MKVDKPRFNSTNPDGSVSCLDCPFADADGYCERDSPLYGLCNSFGQGRTTCCPTAETYAEACELAEKARRDKAGINDHAPVERGVSQMKSILWFIVIVAVVILPPYLLFEFGVHRMTNEEIIAEVKKCEAAGMRGACYPNLDHSIRMVQCEPRKEETK